MTCESDLGLACASEALFTVSALIATERTGELADHLGRALDEGMKPIEISEFLIYLAFYSDGPALRPRRRRWTKSFVSAALIQTRFVPLQESASPPSIYGSRSGQDGNRTGRAHVSEAGGAHERAFVRRRLAPARPAGPRPQPRHYRGRQPAGDAAQLAFKCSLGLRAGWTREEVSEAITHLAFYVGWPKRFWALPSRYPGSR